MNNIQYEHPTLKQAEQIAKVHIQSWQETYKSIVPQDYLDNLSDSYSRRKEMWEKTIKTDASSLWIATHKEEVIGFSSFGKNRDSQYPYSAEIYAIYLLQSFQGQGVGKQLLQKSLESLSREDHQSCLVWVLKDNPTVGFYKNLGAELVGEIEEEVGGAMLWEQAYAWKSL